MRNKFSKVCIVRLLCLLFSVGIFFICPLNLLRAHATNHDSNLTGTTDTATNITDAGSADSADDLGELNIANTVSITYNDDNGSVSGSLRVLLTLTAIAVLPTILLMMTSFTRCLIVLHFTRAALNTQTAPPNQILIGIALILTIFIMQPTFTEIYEEAVLPFENGVIEQEEALETGLKPLREFMYKQTQTKDVEMFMQIARNEWSGELNDIPTTVLIPSFMVSELRTAFIIGFVLYIPFLIIDMVVASTLMSMGMMMLPPTTISMPFKILLFVVADGWNLVIMNLVKTF